jgi:hypothetical protein
MNPAIAACIVNPAAGGRSVILFIGLVPVRAQVTRLSRCNSDITPSIRQETIRGEGFLASTSGREIPGNYFLIVVPGLSIIPA